MYFHEACSKPHIKKNDTLPVCKYYYKHRKRHNQPATKVPFNSASISCSLGKVESLVIGCSSYSVSDFFLRNFLTSLAVNFSGLPYQINLFSSSTNIVLYRGIVPLHLIRSFLWILLVVRVTTTVLNFTFLRVCITFCGVS